MALGWPLANQQPPVAGHPRPTWSTSPNIHIDLVVLADRRANPLLSTLPRRSIPPLPSLSILHPVQHTVSFSPCGPPLSFPPRTLFTLVQRSLEREKVVPDQRARKFSKVSGVWFFTDLVSPSGVVWGGERRENRVQGDVSFPTVLPRRAAANRDCSRWMEGVGF